METQATESSEASPPQEQTPVEVVKKETPKKERSEAQKAATQKALAAMTIARKEKAKRQLEKKEEVKIAKKVIEKKIVDENLAFATKKDIEAMRKDLLELRALHEANKIVKEMPVAASKPERIVERVIERVPTAPAQPTKLSGHALLDKLFFEK